MFRLTLALLSLSIIHSAYASAPCGGPSVGYWTNPDGIRGGWVAGTAKVQTGAFISPEAQVCESAQVQSGAKILDNAFIGGRSIIYLGGEVSGRAKVQGEAKIGGSPSLQTKIGGDALVEGSSVITGNTNVFARAKVVNGKIHNSIVCQASIIEGISVNDSNYYCQTEDPEPKDPGELGKKTLLGVDSDRDGVRDDVEIWINGRFSNTPNKDMYNYRMAYKQMARSDLNILRFKSDKNKVKQAAFEGFDAIDCINNLMVDKSKDLDTRLNQLQETNELRKEYEAVFFNTKDRVISNLKVDQYLHGVSLISSKKTKNGCYFEVKK